jgi:hypothetical protein
VKAFLHQAQRGRFVIDNRHWRKDDGKSGAERYPSTSGLKTGGSLLLIALNRQKNYQAI